MTLKEFLGLCNTNTVDITISDIHDNIIFDGMLYLAYHFPNDTTMNLYDGPKYNPDLVLNSNILAWGMNNQDGIDICTDFTGF